MRNKEQEENASWIKRSEEIGKRESRRIVKAEIGRLEERLESGCREDILESLKAIERTYRAAILFDPNRAATPAGLKLLRELCVDVIDAVDQLGASRERIARLYNTMKARKENDWY